MPHRQHKIAKKSPRNLNKPQKESQSDEASRVHVTNTFPVPGIPFMWETGNTGSGRGRLRPVVSASLKMKSTKIAL
jgi:hypothetical protein